MSKADLKDFDDHTFLNFRNYIYDNCGIVIKEDKKVFLGSRLRKRIKTLHLTGYDEYWNYLINNSQSSIEKYNLFEAITINETYFQRGNNHYKILADYVLPEFSLKHGNQIKIWSCGTSTGEEAYDLSMVSLEYEKDHPELKISIIGTDVSKRVLEFARNAEYADRRINQLTEYQIHTYFNQISPENSTLPYAKKVLSVKPLLKEKVNFQYQNIMSDDYILDVDVLFCRNVLIYFDKQTQYEIMQKFYNSLNHGGYLFLGYSEVLNIMPEKLVVCRFPEGTIYKKEF
ncbi:MAG: hypothetical protein OEV78_00540 [Spirochaetia bacterium]|nr:hypothetical protein [Spirochaetia bacterium]